MSRWLAQDKRGRQGAWVATMPRTFVGVVDYSAPPACPLVMLVGACCKGCAEGKGCEGEEEIKHLVGEASYPTSAIDELDGLITKLNVDMAQAGPSLQIQWSGFHADWSVWYAARQAAFTLGFITEPYSLEFEAYSKRYNELLEAATTSDVKTTAKPSDIRSPASKAGSAVSDAAGAAAGALTTAIMWIAIAGAVGLVLYVAGPPLIAKALK